MDTKRNLAPTDTPDAESVHIGFRVPPDLAEEFEQVAKRNERTVSAELRHLMRQRIDDAKAAAA